MSLVRIDCRLHSHPYLEDDDVCYFMHEYTARAGFSYSPTNQLISNLKKPMSARGRQGWHYKQGAIDECAKQLLSAAGMPWLSSFTLVPIPPSASKTDPSYDDRMVRVLQRMGHGDVREMIVQRSSMEPFHHGDRRTVETLMEEYDIDEALTTPPPISVLLCDDVLTNGTHFKAIKNLLMLRLGQIDVQGLFIARCVHLAQVGTIS